MVKNGSVIEIWMATVDLSEVDFEDLIKCTATNHEKRSLFKNQFDLCA